MVLHRISCYAELFDHDDNLPTWHSSAEQQVCLTQLISMFEILQYFEFPRDVSMVIDM